MDEEKPPQDVRRSALARGCEKFPLISKLFWEHFHSLVERGKKSNAEMRVTSNGAGPALPRGGAYDDGLMCHQDFNVVSTQKNVSPVEPGGSRADVHPAARGGFSGCRRLSECKSTEIGCNSRNVARWSGGMGGGRCSAKGGSLCCSGEWVE